ncbi:MAG: cation/acetate symporter [Chloroflexi bacterium]|nr:MAG: cation/acetate symporter [Chloroflexota bacterium]MBA4375758.1 cation acetate symporter [Anaerolinea sp.]
MAIFIFLIFVFFVIGLSLYLGKKTKTSSAYYAAGGKIHWGVNGVAFAGDYLSAASFLGICGMIATVGFDGFLYSIGYLAGWIVALFVVAEPLKKLGKYTFTDALDANYNSRGIKLAAAISTLVVSIFYLIPQMVGAGVLVEPLLGIPHSWGVLMVGAIVITIVATAGMASTTYVQFLKGFLLVIFSSVLVAAVVIRGLSTQPDQGGKVAFYEYSHLSASRSGEQITVNEAGWSVLEQKEIKGGLVFVKLGRDNMETWWSVSESNGAITLDESQSVVVKTDGKWINGAPASSTNHLRQVGNLEKINGESNVETGRLSLFGFLSTLTNKDTMVQTWKTANFVDGAGEKVTVYYPKIVSGDRIMRPGLKFKVEGTWLEKLDFLSLMLALFMGTAALPHILIRYYTVPNPASARKSTIVAIGAIGFFYILTLFMGFGALVNGTVNPADSNMAAPLLARSFSELLFAVISAIAFATVLGTVSGLIVAASGAVAHDLFDRYLKIKMDDHQKVTAGKIAAFVIGGIAILLGILFKGMNVSFLVGLAFAVAASANLPAILMMLFWKKTTARGIAASIVVGIVSSLALIAFSPELYTLYGRNPLDAPIPLNNPGIVSIPLSFITLIVVSLLTVKKKEAIA